MRKLAFLLILGLGWMAAPANAERPTPTEEAAEACEQPEIVAEFGHDNVDYCYEAYLDELQPGAPRKIEVFEDGSGVLQYVEGTDWHERTFPADTFTWDCSTMGNKVCGPETIEPVVLAELPRTN